MPETRDIDFYTQVYRCVENIHSLVLRVGIKKAPLTLVKGYEEVCESEERDFLWQERVYCRNEIIFYSNPSNCVTVESKQIHEDVKEIHQDPGSQKWLFSFSKLPSEDYRNMIEKNIFANNFQSKKETCESYWQKDEEIIQTTVYGRSIVDYYPRKVADKVLSNDGREQAMYILANFNDDSMSHEKNVLLCCIKWNPVKKTVQIFPDFCSPGNFETGYSVILDKHPQVSLEYWIHQVLPENGKMPLSQAVQYPEVPIRNNFIMPREGYLDFYCFGEIKKAFDFDCSKLFINYIIETPNGWMLSYDNNLRGTTAIARQHQGESAFCHLFEGKLTLNLAVLENNPGNIKLPEMLLEVKSLDYWGHSRVEGYGRLQMSFYPGCYTLVVPTWKPALASISDRLQYFFTGISPQLMDSVYLGTSYTNQKVPYLSRYGFTTAASGKVVLQLNAIHHFKTSPGEVFSNKNTVYILEKLNVSTLLNSVNSVVKAFKEAHSKMFNCSDSL